MKTGIVRKLRVRVLCVVFALLAACTTSEKPRTIPAPPAQPAPGQPAPPATVEVSAFEQRIINATNAFRARNGLPPLKPTVRLIVVAQNHARNMARQDKFGDTDKNGHVLDGKRLEDRLNAGGYVFTRAAENVGYQRNRPDPAGAMMQRWEDSPGHRKNMLLPDVTEIGVGAAKGASGRWYFVQVFGSRQPAAASNARAIDAAASRYQD